MAKKVSSRRELLDRWRGIEEEEEEEDNDAFDRHRLHQRKEEWFVDAFNFLISLPKENHIWCGSWDLMGPLLETFYNYFKDERHDSPLKLLWKRISGEMQQCIQCTSQHHQAQEMYEMEYELSTIGPLLEVLRSLDEERVTQHLREINERLAHQLYDPISDNIQVVSVMYEVLMFPVLLDDQFLFNEFEKFIEAVDNMHELALEGHQQFPGVYALLFFNRRVRTVGRRLARCMGKLRRTADLEPLQPLLKKFIGFLESEVLPSTSKTSRPRSQLERLPIWLGITSLLEFLEPPVLEEGILERYPIFFDIVLNHISGDSPEFSHAVGCLRELFKMLGCKLWLRSTLSPSVMRNTLMGQCFHTRNEKIHKDIFDLFQPFLQSLEALQDGEHEKQRRHFLYFLLHQVPVSSNFSVLTKQLSCKIALLIIQRGYMMSPPCPPFECAHMWGPFLVSSLKDSSLHSSLRQPAFDLIQTIIVSDAAALITSMMNSQSCLSSDRVRSVQMNDDECEHKLLFHLDEEKDDSSWSEFSVQSENTSQEYRGWMCIPMLWIDVLVNLDPSVLPVSFSKAVFWARSRFSILEPETSAEMALDVRTWLSSSVTEISSSFGWKVPTGCDDVTKNALEVSTICLPLIKTFKRLTAHFSVQVGQGELRKQWTWEPRMGESLILSLVDPNDNVRQIGKCILEQVSNTRGLSGSLKFLCSYNSSLFAVFHGLRHALKLVQLDSVLLKFQNLHHFFFILRKVFEEGRPLNLNVPEKSPDHSSITMFSSQGGFLRQPVFESSDVNNGHLSNIDPKILRNFHHLLSQITWPSLGRCLQEGRTVINYTLCQMACIRLLEILPVVFGRLHSFVKPSGDCFMTLQYSFDFKWLLDLMDWGKSKLQVIVVYWKRTVTSLLNLLKESCGSTTFSARAIEDLISSDNVDVDQITEKVSLLCVSLSRETSSQIGKTSLEAKVQSSEGFSFVKSSSDLQPFPVRATDAKLDSDTGATIRKDDIIVLSDDETEKELSANQVVSSDASSEKCLSYSKIMAPTTDKSSVKADSCKKNVPSVDSKDVLDISGEREKRGTGIAPLKQSLDESRGKPLGSLKPKAMPDKRKETNSEDTTKDLVKSQGRVGLMNQYVEPPSCKPVKQGSKDTVAGVTDSMLKNLVHDAEDDPLERALKSGRPQHSILTKSGPFVPKRQVIQLKSPFENRSGQLHRLGSGVKRFTPLRLDDWYRPILELDYFATVGLASVSHDGNRALSNLKEVPVCFQSPEQYVNIFRPLVLEEFKAQLQSSFLEMSSLEEMYSGWLSVLSVERVDDFHLVRFVHDEDETVASQSFSENDLVLLTREALQKTPHDFHVLGKVERRERDNKRKSSMLLIRFYFQNGTSRLNQARRQLLERSKWHASRVMSITPQLREFQALSSIKEIPILPAILKPVNFSSDYNTSGEVDLGKLPQPLQGTLKTSFNESQLQAITTSIGSSSRKKDIELSLIQGPPGTGKTRTIVAIVSSLLATRKSLNGHSRQSYSSCINSKPKISHPAAVARAWQDAALARQLNDDVDRDKRSLENTVRGRVLICAQSNAAVDELVSRISSEGLYGSDGKMYKPYLVRVGNIKTVHPNSLPFFIDTLVDLRLAEEKMHASETKNDFSAESSMTLRSNLEKVADRIRFYEAKRASRNDGNSDLSKMLEDEADNGPDVKEMSEAELDTKLKKLYEQKKHIYKDLSAAQARERKSYEETKAWRHKLRKTILKEAEIAVTTLSGCGGDLYGVCSESMSNSKFSSPSENTLFDAVVIDEAAQALEPATLIPLQLLKSEGTKCIMVGDPKQLPATVLSNVASKFMYECSMFERLQKAGYPVVMLTKQYRMHPDICRFPSQHFYERKLLNGEKMSDKTASFHVTEGLGPYVFYDIIDGQELRGKKSGSFSLYNEHEAEAAVELIRFFRKRFPSEFVGGRIGIITPYKSQLMLLRNRFSSAFGSSVSSDIEFNTIDGFQGREVDILILSTVRAADSSSAQSEISKSTIGFVADVRRMNVALTRARLSLWILGNARTLQNNRNWAALLKDAKERNLVISIKRPYGSMFRSAYKKNATPSNHNDCANRQKNVAKNGDSGTSIKQNGCKSKADVKTKEKYTGENDGISDKLEDLQIRERSARREPKSLVKENQNHPLAANAEHSRKKNVNSAALGESECDGERRIEDRSIKKFDSGAPIGKNRKDRRHNSKSDKGHTEDTVVNNNSSKSKELKGPNRTSDHDRSCRKMKNSTSVAGGSPMEQEADDKGRDTRADLIAKRKQQREAVDAILNSSLVSSKKSKSSIKSGPSKRSHSPTSMVSSGGMRSPKKRKAPLESSSSAAAPDQTKFQRHGKKTKRLSN